MYADQKVAITPMTGRLRASSYLEFAGLEITRCPEAAGHGGDGHFLVRVDQRRIGQGQMTGQLDVITAFRLQRGTQSKRGEQGGGPGTRAHDDRRDRDTTRVCRYVNSVTDRL